MSNAEIRQELEKLREQVAALAAARRRNRTGREPEPDVEEPEAGSEHTEAEHTIRQQLEEIIKMFQEEIHDMPAMPTLAVFMLGVIVGRHLR